MMLFQQRALGSDGHVQALTGGTSRSIVSGIAYDGRQPLVTAAADAASDSLIGGFRVRADGRVRITDATLGVPDGSFINAGVRVTATGRLCVALEDVGADVTRVQGMACKADGRVYMSAGAEPVNSVLPVITGDTAGEDCTVSNGTWSGSPTFSYRWFLDGVGIEGEIAATITTDESWAGSTLSAVVWATNDGGAIAAEAAGVVLIEDSPPPSYTGPLDKVPGAVSAFDNRAMSAAKLGTPAYILVRSSDDAELSIITDATDGSIDQSAVIAWRDAAGVATAHEKTWADQGVAGKNISQVSLTDYRPEWVPNLFGGKPGFRANATGEQAQLYADESITNSAGAATIIAVVSERFIFGINGDTTLDAVSCKEGFAQRASMDMTDNNAGTEAGGDVDGGVLVKAISIYEWRWEYGSRRFRLNGLEYPIEQINDDGGPIASFSGMCQLTLGVPTSRMVAALFYDAIKSDADCNLLLNDYADYYHVTLPATAPVIGPDPSDAGALLSVTNGTWGVGANAVYTYQWIVNNAEVGGATNSTYQTVTPDQDGKRVSCVVTNTNDDGAGVAVSQTITLGTPP